MTKSGPRLKFLRPLKQVFIEHLLYMPGTFPGTVKRKIYGVSILEGFALKYSLCLRGLQPSNPEILKLQSAKKHFG